jgi:aminoglycoside 3-N-acetyltransferase
MSEAEAIRASEKPVTLSTLTSDLEQLGVRAGMVLLVHTRLSALGWVCGGAITVIQALQQVLRPYGTLLMPTHSGDLSDPAGWQNPPVPESWWETIRQTMPAFDPESTPSRGVGVIPEHFRCQADVLRSSHPQVSFAAWGEKALQILQNHSLAYSLGEESPLARLYDLQGWVLLLGTDFSSNTSFHLAEYRCRKAPDKLKYSSAPVASEGHRRWKRFKDIDFFDEDFAHIGREFLSHCKSEIRIGTVGYGRAILFSQVLCVDYTVKWMDRNRKQ